MRVIGPGCPSHARAWGRSRPGRLFVRFGAAVGFVRSAAVASASAKEAVEALVDLAGLEPTNLQQFATPRHAVNDGDVTYPNPQDLCQQLDNCRVRTTPHRRRSHPHPPCLTVPSDQARFASTGLHSDSDPSGGRGIGGSHPPSVADRSTFVSGPTMAGVRSGGSDGTVLQAPVGRQTSRAPNIRSRSGHRFVRSLHRSCDHDPPGGTTAGLGPTCHQSRSTDRAGPQAEKRPARRALLQTGLWASMRNRLDVVSNAPVFLICSWSRRNWGR